jgi:AcrR family transcriptional regulator
MTRRDDNDVMPTDESGARPKRKDAARNNERLVLAARQVFANKGLSATLEDIAQVAGVGVGTVYRNFASKREIVETLYDAAIDSALADAQAAMHIEDPWVALVTFFEVTAASQAADRGLHETLLGRDGLGPSRHTTEKIVATLTPLFDRATAAGILREGVTVTDMSPIFAMLSGVYRMSETRPELWRRYLAIVLDGLRATDRPALTVPALDVAAFTAALNAAG